MHTEITLWPFGKVFVKRRIKIVVNLQCIEGAFYPQRPNLSYIVPSNKSEVIGTAVYRKEINLRWNI